MAKKKNTTTRRKNNPKGIKKLKPYVAPAATVGTFGLMYDKRAKDLFEAGSIEKDSIFKAISYDIKNFESAESLDRLKDNAGEIISLVGLGWILKETKLLGKDASAILGDVMVGAGAGFTAKTILDPPLPENKINPLGVPDRVGKVQVAGAEPLGVAVSVNGAGAGIGAGVGTCAYSGKWEV